MKRRRRGRSISSTFFCEVAAPRSTAKNSFLHFKVVDVRRRSQLLRYPQHRLRSCLFSFLIVCFLLLNGNVCARWTSTFTNSDRRASTCRRCATANTVAHARQEIGPCTVCKLISVYRKRPRRPHQTRTHTRQLRRRQCALSLLTISRLQA